MSDVARIEDLEAKLNYAEQAMRSQDRTQTEAHFATLERENEVLRSSLENARNERDEWRRKFEELQDQLWAQETGK